MEKEQCYDCKKTTKGLIIRCKNCLVLELDKWIVKRHKLVMVWISNPTPYNQNKSISVNKKITRIQKMILK